MKCLNPRREAQLPNFSRLWWAQQLTLSRMVGVGGLGSRDLLTRLKIIFYSSQNMSLGALG